MTLILTEDDIEKIIEMPDCLRVIEETFRDFGLGQAVSRPRSHTYTHLAPGTFYNFKSMDGCVPRYGVHALRLSSEVLQSQDHLGKMREEKLPLAPGGRYKHDRAFGYYAGSRPAENASRSDKRGRSQIPEPPGCRDRRLVWKRLAGASSSRSAGQDTSAQAFEGVQPQSGQQEDFCKKAQ